MSGVCRARHAHNSRGAVGLEASALDIRSRPTSRVVMQCRHPGTLALDAQMPGICTRPPASAVHAMLMIRGGAVGLEVPALDAQLSKAAYVMQCRHAGALALGARKCRAFAFLMQMPCEPRPREGASM